MPQNSLRSVVYRSFLTCNDPKGVAESNSTITKSDSHKKQKMQQNSITTNPLYRNNPRVMRDSHHSTHSDRKSVTVSGTEDPRRNSNASLSCEEESKDFENQSSFRLMEVSKGAKKLNEVIESLSNRPSSVMHSDYIAKDLLKGALDLQDSLVMLGKLHETSRHMPKSRKKDELQKPRNSMDCYEELREVIRESFTRQNLLPNGSSAHEKRKSNVDLLSKDIASSSSSTRWSCDSLPKKKPKGPNLVAKLMGLDEAPSLKHVNLINYERVENKGVSRNVLLDIDLPRPRGNPEFMIRKPAREVRKIEEIIHSMQFKRLVEKKMDYYSDISLPPIVVMKPLHFLHLYENQQKVPKKIKDDKFPVNSVEVVGRHLMNEKLQARKAPKQKLKDRQQKVTGHKPPSVKMKHSEPLNQNTQKKVIVTKKIDNVPKAASAARKQVERKASKSQESVKSEDVGKNTISKLSKNGKGSSVSRGGNNTATEKQNIPKTSSKCSIPNKYLRKDKANSKCSAALVESIPRDDNLFDTTSETVPVEVTIASYSLISDSSPSESSRLAIEDDKYLEDGSFTSHPNSDVLEGCKSITTNTGNFLMCSASFVSHANLLFDTGIGDPPASPTPTGYEHPDADSLLDCAKEMVERKFTRIKIYMSSQDYISRKPKCRLSQLVGEVCDGIEGLRSYRKSCGEITPVDILRSMVERDLCWKGEVMAGAWDLGWRNGFTVEQVNQVANELQNLLLSEIVDDTVAEFMY